MKEYFHPLLFLTHKYTKNNNANFTLKLICYSLILRMFGFCLCNMDFQRINVKFNLTFFECDIHFYHLTKKIDMA